MSVASSPKPVYNDVYKVEVIVKLRKAKSAIFDWIGYDPRLNEWVYLEELGQSTSEIIKIFL